MTEEKVVTIVQARMGSSRFPGKMMASLEGRALIEWVLLRCRQAKKVNETVLATSTFPRDDVLAEVAASIDVAVWRGSESDVLGRFAGAAERHRASLVVRICADRPLVDPQLIDSAIMDYYSQEADLVYNHITGQGQRWPRGFGAEVLNAELLAWLDGQVTDEQEREHVTLHVWNNDHKFKLRAVRCPAAIDPGIDDLKLDVDRPEDLERLQRICVDMDLYAPTEEVIKRWKRIQ